MYGYYIAGSRTPTDEFEYDPTTGLRVRHFVDDNAGVR